MLFQPPSTSYQEIPYANDPYRSSHPDHLATVAKLSGLTPTAADHCRVLELGCARGGNLIPMALGLPCARFVGIDSSPRQVKEAGELIAQLGLSNIQVELRDILDLDPGIGTFDYIICHGTFSWVTFEVQDRILDIAARNLAPDGIVYISYNTYPGWHLRGLVRDMMCYHVRRHQDPRDRVREARGLLQFMTMSASALDHRYGSLLQEELDYVSQRPDSYLLHDHLETVNEPVYFHEFMERAHARGLRFVSEVQSSVIVPESLPPEIINGLRKLSGDDLEFEQFIDFLINRKFRQSVLCHDQTDRPRKARPEDLYGLYVASRRTGDPAVVPSRDETLVAAALAHLGEIWPLSLPFPSLLPAARSRMATSSNSMATRTTTDADELGSGLLRGYTEKRIELSTQPPSFVVAISNQPLASPLARLQAQVGKTVTNLRHEAGQLSDFGSHVLPLLDGKRDRAAILDTLIQSTENGRITLPSTDPGAARWSSGRARTRRDLLEEMLDDCLKKFARFALLVA